MKIIIKCTDGIMTGKEWRFNGSGQITLGREKGSMVTKLHPKITVFQGISV